MEGEEAGFCSQGPAPALGERPYTWFFKEPISFPFADQRYPFPNSSKSANPISASRKTCGIGENLPQTPPRSLARDFRL